MTKELGKHQCPNYTLDRKCPFAQERDRCFPAGAPHVLIQEIYEACTQQRKGNTLGAVNHGTGIHRTEVIEIFGSESYESED